MNIKQLNELAVKIFNKVEEMGVVDATIPIAETLLPASAYVLEPLNAIYKSANQRKLQYMLTGLSEGVDIEKKMNDLYSYVKNSDRAFYVSECVQKVLLGSAPVVCCIFGLILSDLTRKDDNIDQTDAVLINALSSFTDEDIRNFSDIVSGRYQVEDLGENYIDLQKFPETKKMNYRMTVDLCIQTRIFRDDFAVDSKGVAHIRAINTTGVSDRLMSYVNRARRQLSYGGNSDS